MYSTFQKKTVNIKQTKTKMWQWNAISVVRPRVKHWDEYHTCWKRTINQLSNWSRTGMSQLKWNKYIDKLQQYIFHHFWHSKHILLISIASIFNYVLNTVLILRGDYKDTTCVLFKLFWSTFVFYSKEYKWMKLIFHKITQLNYFSYEMVSIHRNDNCLLWFYFWERWIYLLSSSVCWSQCQCQWSFYLFVTSHKYASIFLFLSFFQISCILYLLIHGSEYLSGILTFGFEWHYEFDCVYHLY